MFANISWPQLLIILVIVLAIFGTKRLRTLGSDLGSAVKGFRKSIQDDDSADQPAEGKQAEEAAGAEKDK